LCYYFSQANLKGGDPEKKGKVIKVILGAVSPNSRQIVDLVGGGQDMLGGYECPTAQVDIRGCQQSRLPRIRSETGLTRSCGGGARWWWKTATTLIASCLAAGHQSVTAGQGGRGARNGGLHRGIMIITLTYYIIIFMLSHISPIIHNPNVQLPTAITGHGRYGIGTGSGWNALAIAVGTGIHYGGHRWPGARCNLRWQQGAHNQLPG